MEQLTQNLKDGFMQILEVPYPALGAGQVLVRNHYSMVSAGTEGKTVRDARAGYLAKARSRREEVKKVIKTARTVGLLETYRLVMNRLDAPSALGYSCAGEVIAVADDVRDFAVGDRVACGGATAVHAEVVAVPVNLCVKLPGQVSSRDAAFTTLGAIALQGVRQADLRLGENCVVIGLGMLGQLTLQLLQAGGIRSAGIDVDDYQVHLAKEQGFNDVYSRKAPQLEQLIERFTDGYGTDAVIITAGTDSLDPVELAGTLCRRKGKVVVVGAVPNGFSRKNYYQKELDLRMSCSYGPGRYDSEYEDKGLDYPYAYVRWTENRNMQAFVELIAGGKIRLSSLTTHVFPLKEAKAAYDLILGKAEPFGGILLEYDFRKVLKEKMILNTAPAPPLHDVRVGLIGAGSFATNFLLKHLAGRVHFSGVATARPNNARHVADKHNFGFCTGNAGDIFGDKDINTVFIATRHDSHARYVIEALEAGKNVFTEKPLCLNTDELQRIKEVYAKGRGRLMVGFNRRFAPLITRLKKQINNSLPCSISYHINAGILPGGHWAHDPETGGGRIIGEVCHFIDLCAFISGSHVKHVSAQIMQDISGHEDTVTISLRMENGSIAGITYFSNGNAGAAKERIEVYQAGTIIRIDDFMEMHIITAKSKERFRMQQDKGHGEEINAFLKSLTSGHESPIHFDSICNTTLSTFRVLESATLNGSNLQV